MAWGRKKKERERFYLLAGMGGRNLRRKKRIFLAWAIVAGILISALVAIGMYLANTRH